MSTASLAMRPKGVWITHLTETTSHPLDSHVEGVRARDDDAFRVLYNAMADDLVSFAFGMVNDRRTAEDIVQQAFVELVKSAPKFKGDGRALRAWLFKSVRFGCLDEYRRRSRRPEIPHEDLPETPINQDPLIHHLDPDLETALDTLSKRHRTVVLLRHVVGLTGEEIALVIGTSRRAAYAILGRAETRLRAAFGGED